MTRHINSSARDVIWRTSQLRFRGARRH